MSEERVGCIGMLLKLIGIELPDSQGAGAGADELPYRQRDDFLSAAELSFCKVLQQAVGTTYVVCPKVSLNDLFYVARPHENKGARNRINRKHVDFVLCDPQTMTPLCAVELDDRSHSRKDRIERDEFVDRVFQAAELPLLHVPAARSYVIQDLQAQISAAVETHKASASPPPLPAEGSEPLCPKCGVELVRRTARKGANKGKEFLGCPNYPKCRHVQDVG